MSVQNNAYREPDWWGELVPDHMYPEQFLSIAGPSTDIPGELRLMLAVLEEAIAQYQRSVLDRRVIRGEDWSDVKSWINTQDTDWPFSFERICDALGIDPEYIRSGLFKWKDRAEIAAKAGEPLDHKFLRPRRVNARKTRVVGARRRGQQRRRKRYGEP